MSSRPTFFLSSTIYDFRDLRSAIKYHLESQGCRVLGSEFTDFSGDLDKHSYEACLANIDKADHFVLLVGGRVGGWYDAAERVSITQQEYRHAYARHRAGSLRLVTLVREEIWNLREDRKALARHLQEVDLADKERKAIAGHASRFATDAEFIGGFLTEIGRNVETARAVKDGGTKPTGNWIHLFRDFRDVADVLAPLTFGGLTADQAAYRKALQHELIEISRLLLLKYKGDALDPRYALKKHIDAYGISREQAIEAYVEIDGPDFDGFATLFYNLMGQHLDMVVILDALTSSLFLVYDGASGGYVRSEAYQALALIAEEIRRLNRGLTDETLALVTATSPRSRGGRDVPVRLRASDLALLHGVASRWINILSLARALILHLEGLPFAMPTLMPFSPIKGMQEAIDAERVSHADARRWMEI